PYSYSASAPGPAYTTSDKTRTGKSPHLSPPTSQSPPDTRTTSSSAPRTLFPSHPSHRKLAASASASSLSAREPPPPRPPLPLPLSSPLQSPPPQSLLFSLLPCSALLCELCALCVLCGEPSFPLSLFPSFLASLCALCVPTSVTSVLPSFFSSSSLLLLFFFSPSSLLLLFFFSPSSLLLLSCFSPSSLLTSNLYLLISASPSQCLRIIVFIAPRAFLTRVAHPPPNSNFKKASAAFSNSLPYRYHQGFSTSFSQSTSTYFTFTISSN